MLPKHQYYILHGRANPALIYFNMSKVYLGLGTNLGDRHANLTKAICLINEKIGKVIAQSSFYETTPWGFESDNNFLNAAVGVETLLPPFEILRLTQEMERTLGRTAKSANGVYADRLIDIDLLMYDNRTVSTTELTLPHPLMTKRSFVMLPLIEIAGNEIHPVFGKQLKELFPKP